MKKHIIYFCLVAVFFFAYKADAQRSDTATAARQTPIALLGTYHFSNPNLDAFNVKSDNVLSPKQQQELEHLVKTMAGFKPTKIAVEYDVASHRADSLYQQYLAGKYELGSGEAEQIGFRLAKLMGHQHIYPVDVRNLELNFNPGELAGDFEPLLNALGKTGNTIIAQINDWVKQYSIGQVLSRLNTDELDKLNLNIYYQFLLPVGKTGHYPGVEAVSRWYMRNLYILHHIMNITNPDGSDRVLVIFGQGHTAMLKQFLNSSVSYKVEDIQRYLPH